MSGIEATDTGVSTGTKRRTEEIVTNLKERAEGLKERAKESAQHFKEQAAGLKQKSIEDLWTGTRDYVKDNPGKSILVSLALGVLVGRLLRRK